MSFMSQVSKMLEILIAILFMLNAFSFKVFIVCQTQDSQQQILSEIASKKRINF